MIGTKEAAAILGVQPGRLVKAIWENRITQPTKGPGGNFIWSKANLRQASWVLLGHDLEDEKKLENTNEH